MRFCSVTLGCKVNQYETQALENILASRGHTAAKLGDGCDVCIVNTCAVTAESSRKSRQAARRVRKLEPDALIAVCGCLSELESANPNQFGADIVGGSGDRAAFALEIERMYLERASRRTDAPLSEKECIGNVPSPNRHERSADFEELPPGSAAGRTRALLKIQDGCDSFCAYCVIPYARGRVRSLPASRATEFAAQLDGQGYREIVVTGIEISSYGKDLHDGLTLADIVKKIGGAASNARIRLGSLDPGTVDSEFCDKVAAVTNLCDHFHLSLQSGCDETLRRMGRKYDTAVAGNAIAMLRSHFPNCGITADLITGFPGETDAEFQQTMEFITEAQFSDMHIFPFSLRPGTRAADMGGQVEKAVRRERARIATQAAAEMSAAFRRGQVGRTLRTLFERESGGSAIGHTDNYIEVAVRLGKHKNTARSVKKADAAVTHKAARNSMHNVQITTVDDRFVWAEIV